MMRNKGLPSNKQWDKIINEAFSSDKDHDFSVMYELRRSEIQKGNTMKKTSNYFHRRYMSMMAAAAAVVVAVPTGVFAFTHINSNSSPSTNVDSGEQPSTNNILNEEAAASAEAVEPTTEIMPDELSSEEYEGVLQLTQSGNYEYILRYKPTEEETANDQKYTVNYSILPDGFYAIPDDPKNSYQAPTGGIFDSACYRVGRNTTLNEVIGNIVSYDDVSDNEKEAYIFYRNVPLLGEEDPANNFGRVAYVRFKGTNFVTVVYATDDISENDFQDIVKGMELVPTDEERTGSWRNQESYSQGQSMSDEEIHEQYIKGLSSVDDVYCVAIGETVAHSVQNNSVSVTLNDAWIQDDFEGITTDTIGRECDFSGFIGEDGKIYQTYYWMKYGDGKDTLDEVAEKEKVQMKVVVLDLTYTNTSDHDIRDDLENQLTDFLIDPNLYYNIDGKLDGLSNMYKDGMTAVTAEHLASEGGWISFETDNKSSKNHINIPQGGQTHVKVALVADADMINDCYIDIFGSYSENIKANPYFPVSEIAQ